MHQCPPEKCQPQAFGGILHYAMPALASFEQEQQCKHQQATIRACQECDSAGRLHFKKADGDYFAAQCPHDLRMIQAREQRDGLTHFRM
jgi:hypothetical protein